MRLEPQKQAPTQQKPASNAQTSYQSKSETFCPPTRAAHSIRGPAKKPIRRRTHPAATGNLKADVPNFSQKISSRQEVFSSAKLR
jgi:hypothetical protein